MAKQDIFKSLDVEFQKSVPPPDTFTIMQYARHLNEQGQNLTRDQARVFVTRMEREGIIEFIGHFGTGRERHYKLKGAK